MKHITLRLGGQRCTVDSIVKLLVQHELDGAIFSGASVWKQVVEPCLELQLWNITQPQLAQLWEHIRQECDVQCAHVRNHDGSKAGCILDYLRPSLCPTTRSSPNLPCHDNICVTPHPRGIFAMDLDF